MVGKTWPITTLEEVASDITVGYVGTMANEYVSNGIPFLRSLNIEPFRVNDKDLKFINKDFHFRIEGSALKPGDVVIVRTGAPGTCAVIPPSLPRANCSDLIIVRCGTRLDPYFVACFVNSIAKGQIRANLVGAVQQHFNVQSAKKLKIKLPPIRKQRAIAHILRTLDEKIELNRKMNETLEAMARALFKSWFVDFDPVRAKAEGRDTGLPNEIADLFPDEFEDSELREIPKGWRVKTLDEIADFINGLAMQKFPPTGKEFLPVIKIAQLRSGNISGADRASPSLDPTYVVSNGDILFSWSGSLECVLWSGGKGALNQHLFKVVPRLEPKCLCFFAIQMHLEEFRKIAAGKATTMGHIQRHHLSEAKIALPSLKLTNILGKVIEPILECIWKRNVESQTIAIVRETLLPKLISGELRVPEAGRLVEQEAIL